MRKHVDLFGNPLPPREPRTPVRVRSAKGVLYPWSGVCCKACYFARKKPCVCKCGGKYHRLGRVVGQVDSFFEGHLTVEQSKPFWDQMTRDTCTNCDTSVAGSPILYRKEPNEGGWRVKGMLHKAWLYIRCPRCRIDMALWKLGVKRE